MQQQRGPAHLWDRKMTKEEEYLDYMQSLCDANGVICSSVKGGTMFIFKRDRMREIIDANAQADKIVIFVKQNESRESN